MENTRKFVEPCKLFCEQQGDDVLDHESQIEVRKHQNDLEVVERGNAIIFDRLVDLFG